MEKSIILIVIAALGVMRFLPEVQKQPDYIGMHQL